MSEGDFAVGWRRRPKSACSARGHDRASNLLNKSVVSINQLSVSKALGCSRSLQLSSQPHESEVFNNDRGFSDSKHIREKKTLQNLSTKATTRPSHQTEPSDRRVVILDLFGIPLRTSGKARSIS